MQLPEELFKANRKSLRSKVVHFQVTYLFANKKCRLYLTQNWKISQWKRLCVKVLPYMD